MDPSLAFLVYDSRSGSTILSQLLARRYADLYVTPELAFDTLLADGHVQNAPDGGDRKDACDQRARRLIASRGMRNLHATEEVIEAIVTDCRNDAGRVIEALLQEHLKQENQNPDVDPANKEVQAPTSGGRGGSVLVKNGSHLKYVAELQAALGSRTQFVFLYRDPRDVIASKCVTPRPYKPSEMMAWGGVFLAAVRWNLYAKAALEVRRRGGNILFIKYETLVHSPDEVINEIGDFLNLSQVAKGESSHYVVPDKERGIHQLAIKGQIVSTRVNRWQSILSEGDVVAVEYLCRRSMLHLGYEASQEVGVMKQFCSVIKALTVSMVKVFIRYAALIPEWLFAAMHPAKRSR